jgi:hypothetical protein
MGTRGDGDPKVALDAADAWLRFALVFVEEVAADPDNAHRLAFENLGELVVSATQLLTAIEYYLRALGMRLKLELTRKHELLPLFRALPNDLQDRIEQNTRAVAPGLDGRAAAVELIWYVAAPGQPPPKQPPNDPGRSAAKDVHELVRRYSNLVNDWRFLFERGTVGQYSRLHYDFDELRRLALGIRQTLAQVDPQLFRTRSQPPSSV